MRRTAPILAATTAALLIAAPAALAHDAAGSAACSLENGHPVVRGSVTYQHFQAGDEPVGVQMWVNGTVVEQPPRFSFPGATFTWRSGPHAGAAGVNHVSLYSAWRTSSMAPVHVDVVCPAPIAPPAPPAPPVPVPPRVVPPPVPPTPTPPTRPRVVKVRASIDYLNRDPQRTGGARARIVVEHPGLVHGLQTFRLRVSGGQVIHSSVRWYVRGKRVSQRHWTHVVRGVILRSWLFDGPPMVDGGVWSRPHVYGHYRVTATARVRVPAGARAARSSWS